MLVFDLDRLLDDCRAARSDPDPRQAVRDVLRRAMSRPDEVAAAMQPAEGGFRVLYGCEDLTVLHFVWAPHMTLFPHDHRMWAAIGIYAGQEDNTFYRRTSPSGSPLVASGGKELTTGEVLVLGDEAIHAVANPKAGLTGAIHVYGGDFVNQRRSQWGPGRLEERPFNMGDVERQFAEANRRWLNGAGEQPGASRPRSLTDHQP